MEGLLENSGFDIIYYNEDVVDPELNVDGAASHDMLENWKARLVRMERLKGELGEDYHGFCRELIPNMESEKHKRRGNVKFVVAQK